MESRNNVTNYNASPNRLSNANASYNNHTRNSLNLINTKTKLKERTVEEKSKDVFDFLCTLNDDQKNINLDFIRKLYTLNKDNLQLENPAMKILTSYHLTESIKNGKFRNDNLYDEVLSKEEFSNFITGKNMKKLLFAEDNFENKRFNTEEYCKLYSLMDGDSKGLSKQNLIKSMTLAYKFFNSNENGNDFYTEDIGSCAGLENLSKIKIEEEADDILSTLAGESMNGLSLKEFINIMTSEGDFPFNEDPQFFTN